MNFARMAILNFRMTSDLDPSFYAQINNILFTHVFYVFLNMFKDWSLVPSRKLIEAEWRIYASVI